VPAEFDLKKTTIDLLTEQAAAFYDYRKKKLFVLSSLPSMMEQALLVLHEGYAGRIMLEISPERTFAVLSPAFKSCEGGFALQSAAEKGCSFLLPDKNCELHATPFLPLECAFCHHERVGQGRLCHADLERDWNTPHGQLLVKRWCRQMGWWDLLDSFGLEWLKK
jgi:hypothetical protein